LLLALCAVSWRAQAAFLPEAEIRFYDAAFQQAEKKRYAQARAESAKGNHRLLNTFFVWLDLSHTKADGDFHELTAFLEANADWPRLAKLQRRAEKGLPEDLSDAQVLAWFEGRPPLTAEGATRLAEALRNTGDDAAATELLRNTWVTADFSKSEERSFRKRYGAVLLASDEHARLERLLQRRGVAAAQRQAARIGKGYPELAEARLKLSLDRAGVDAAIKRVPAALLNDPGLLYERARWRQRRGRTDGVVQLLDQAAAVIRRPERWWRLRHWAAQQVLRKGQHDAAYRVVSRHGLKDGVGFAEGEWLAGWIALRFRDDAKLAQHHFVRLYDGVSTPISRARGAYWTAEAAAALNNKEEAERWYRRAAAHGTAFYGQLASARLGQPLSVDLKNAVAVWAADRETYEESDLVRLVHLLGAFDQRKFQRTFLRHLRDQAESQTDYRLLAELSQSVDHMDQAVIAAKRARRLGAFMPDYLFPLPASVYSAVAAAPSPEPALVLAVIRQESAFDPKAISRAGARGLMQLMPATAHQVARQIGVPYQRAMLTENPVANLRLGRAYLQQMLDEFSGTSMLALAAYNAGPHRVVRWIKDNGDPRHPDVDPVDWIERIPFDETRNYVQRVLEGQAVYRLALTGQRTVLPLRPAATELGQAP
jgi:soluble lytic murein transglycosylase